MSVPERQTESVDVVVIGSGPNGSACARVVLEAQPQARVLLVEAGPQLTAMPGVHVKNIRDERDRLLAQIRSQGPGVDEAAAVKTASSQAGSPREQPGVVARLGTALVDPGRADDPGAETLTAAAMSTNVGGMGAHWTCACPHPYGRERIPFIADAEWSGLVDKARELLCVTTDAFPMTRQGAAILRTLSRELDAELPEGRKVQRMPLACRIEPNGDRHWTGTDVVLGPLATDPPENFELRCETLCRQVLWERDRVTGVVLEELRTSKRYVVQADVVVVAADSFRTPQLLWASGIRPRALGHFLNDHVQIMAAVRLDDELVDRVTADLPPDAFPDARREADPMVGVFWVPYSDDAHPFHSQVMHWDMSPLRVDERAGDEGQVVGIGALFGKAEIRYDDCVTFSDRELDAYGMPRMTIDYRFTERDRARIAEIRKHQDRAAAAFGSFAPGREPRVMPPGSSLHYQGTFRMADADDGESVCDPYARVWGFRNLFVSGNGVIPTVTAGNSTLTSVAITVRTATAIARELRPAAPANRVARTSAAS